MTVTAADGAKPTDGTREPPTVDAVLTVAPGESFTIHTTGELCAHCTDGTPSLFGSFGAKQTSYSGPHKKAKVVGDGFVSFGHSFLGAQAPSRCRSVVELEPRGGRAGQVTAPARRRYAAEMSTRPPPAV